MPVMACLADDVSVQRRLIVATSFLPRELPSYWNIIADFANQGLPEKRSTVSPESARVAMENVEVLFKDAFVTDTELTKQLVALQYFVTKQPLGIPLVPTETICSLCDGKLLLRRDRPSQMTLYTECMGSVPGTHFHKFCSNNRKDCNFVQFYGYLNQG